MISYIIIYIVGIIITILYFLRRILKRYYTYICSFYYNSKSSDKIQECFDISKDKYNIKSTEKTIIDLKFIIKKPTYLKINKINDLNTKLNIHNNIELKNFLNNNYNKKIISSYINNKKVFINLFLNDDNTYKIKNLESFNIYHKKNFNKNIDSNILLKFYNDSEYQYIFVNNNNLIKIIKNEEYECLTKLIENKNNIFLIQETKNINYITHGGYIKCDINKDKINKIFFNNSKKLNQNLNLLVKFTNLKIFFFVSTYV